MNPAESQKPIVLSNGRSIGPGYPAYIIAEIGSNHDGSLDKAKRLVEAAKKAGADAVKFQSFQVHTLINPHWKPNGKWEPHVAWDLLEKMTVPESWHRELKAHAQSVGIDFFSAAFDEERLALLAEIDVPIIKIASGDLTYHPLLKKIAQLGKPVILSSGAAYLGEVEQALNVLRNNGCNEIILLHCVSLYPTQIHQANIRAMVTLGEAFKRPVGYSDHTPGSVVPLGAVALGACVIEKHLTDDRTLPGPDHPFALTVEEFTEMVDQIRQLEAALGNGIKAPLPEEAMERVMARRALYAKEDLAPGAVVSEAQFKMVRHAYDGAIGPDRFGEVQGKVLKQGLAKDQLLTWEML